MQISSGDLAAELTAAVAGGYLAEMAGHTYTVTSPIVIDVTSTIQGPLGIDLGGAHIVSQITDGSPVIQINVGPGVDLRYLTFSNFTIDGNGREGDGIKIVADGNDRWVYNFTIDNVIVRNVGGYGLDVQGSVFEGLIIDSSMIGNARGGAYFAHSSGGGQVSGLRWYGGTLADNGGAGLSLGNGARDISVDGVSFVRNNGAGISAEQGIASVTGSQFTENNGAGIWFQNFGNFHGNTFANTGAQGTGITGWLNGGATVIDNTVVSHDSDSNSILANLQGYGNVYADGDISSIVTGSNVALSGLGAGNSAQVTLGSEGVALPNLDPITAATTAAVPNSIGTGTLETALRSALAVGAVGETGGTSFTVTSSIVVNLTTSTEAPIGIDLGGATILSQITNGAPVIEIIVGPGVDIGSLTLSNFTLQGNGLEGAGIRIVADGEERSVRLNIEGVNVEHVGGIGIDAIGNVSGRVFNSWMHGNLSGGGRFANSAGGGTAEDLQWVGGGFRKNGVSGLILDNGTRDMIVKGAYFVENFGPGINATDGIALIQQSGFENNNGVGALVQGQAAFVNTTFSTWGIQQAAIGGYLSGEQITLIGSSHEYYGPSPDNTVLANIQGSGTLSIAGGGKVIASSGIVMTGLADLTMVLPPGESVVVVDNDFNGDGQSDVLWYNLVSGEVVQHHVDDDAITGSGLVAVVASELGWSIVGTGDFDGNGKADILWHNGITGEVHQYLLDGVAIVGSGPVAVVPPEQGWSIADTGDFNGDHRSDILWRNISGELHIYLMNGTSIEANGTFASVSDPNWTIVGTGDFDGNRKADILWYNTLTGAVHEYLMDDLSIASNGTIAVVAPELGWSIAGIGDFDGDIRSDILWRNDATGEVHIYFMNGTSVVGNGSVTTVAPELGWAIADTGDYNGDGRSDILWRHDSGVILHYEMNGLAVVGVSPLAAVADPNWQIVN